MFDLNAQTAGVVLFPPAADEPSRPITTTAPSGHNMSHHNGFMVGMNDCIAYAICGAITRQTHHCCK